MIKEKGNTKLHYLSPTLLRQMQDCTSAMLVNTSAPEMKKVCCWCAAGVMLFVSVQHLQNRKSRYSGTRLGGGACISNIIFVNVLSCCVHVDNMYDGPATGGAV